MSNDTNNNRLFLLDAMALIYRAYYALNKNPRINSKGVNTSAILGFTNTLIELIKNEKPTHISVAFDSYGPTFRHEEYAEYKAHREKMPEDISVAIPIIKEIILAMNIPILEIEGFEADDIIGTIAKKAEKNGFTTYMMTPDKDYAQLVSDNIFMYKPSYRGNGIDILGVKEITEKFQLKDPKQVIDLLGLWGDSSDNIPGVPGIGEKTATQLLQQFESIDDILAHPEKIEKEKLRQKILDHAEIALLSKKLATIITDIPIDIDLETMKSTYPNMDTLVPVLEELEFRTLLKRIQTIFQPKNLGELSSSNSPQQNNPFGQLDLFGSPSNSDTPADSNNSFLSTKNSIGNTPHEYTIIASPEQRQWLAEHLLSFKEFCFDTETTGLEVNNSALIGIAFSAEKGKAFYMPLSADMTILKEELQPFAELFTHPTILKIGHNLKFDINFLQKYGINVSPPYFDTMLAHYLIEPEQRHNMDVLAENYLDYSPISYESIAGAKGKNQKTLNNIPLEEVKEYAAEDADITLQLKECFAPLIKINGVESLFNNIEIPLMKVLADMELIGVKIDTDAINSLSLSLADEIAILQNDIYEYAGETFNISSPKQLGEILFEKLNIVEKAKRTKTKQYATGEEVLKKLVNRHPIIDKILEYRQLTKLKSTYVDALPALIDPYTGRLHTSYNQAVTSTGRLSSTHPNLQNIPIRTPKGQEIRKAFVARDDNHVLLAADYSQVELRIMAALSNDTHLIDAFCHGEDIHTATASRIFHVPLAEVTTEMRRKAKTANFGIIYGISPFGLSERLNISRYEAADIINTYFSQYPAVKTYMDECIEQARQQGYVETIMHRRRYIKDILSGNAVVRGVAERNAINTPIQGSSADIIKIAMINIHNKINSLNMQSKMILQVHDELVFDVPLDEVEMLSKLVRTEMVNAATLTVPLVVDINTGKNWLEAH